MPIPTPRSLPSALGFQNLLSFEALIDRDGPEGPIAIMESGAIMLYLVEKFPQQFYPHGARERCECMQWLFWQVGGQGWGARSERSGAERSLEPRPMTGNFGHFKVYAPQNEA